MGPRIGLLIIGFIVGVVGFYYGGEPRTEIEIREVEKIVEKLVPVEKTVVKRVEVPKIVEKTVVKQVEVPISKTRIIYLPTKPQPGEISSEEQYCMALNMYREAMNQSVAGMIAVGRVVMNRVKDRRWPSTPCEVIYEGPTRESWKTRQTEDPDDAEFYPIRHRCQFSWYCDGKKDDPVDKNAVSWKLAEDIAFNILAYDRWAGMVEGANHYHADYVKPKWRKQMRLVTKIDDHIFYRQN